MRRASCAPNVSLLSHFAMLLWLATSEWNVLPQDRR